MMIYFGQKLKSLRDGKRLTQGELAKLLGVSASMISSYERGGNYPSVDVLIKMGQLFKVSTDYLLGLTEEDRFDLDKLTDEQAVAVLEIIREYEKANAQKRG